MSEEGWEMTKALEIPRNGVRWKGIKSEN